MSQFEATGPAPIVILPVAELLPQTEALKALLQRKREQVHADASPPPSSRPARGQMGDVQVPFHIVVSSTGSPWKLRCTKGSSGVLNRGIEPSTGLLKMSLQLLATKRFGEAAVYHAFSIIRGDLG